MEQELKINFSIRIQLPEQSLATMFSRKEKKKIYLGNFFCPVS